MKKNNKSLCLCLSLLFFASATCYGAKQTENFVPSQENTTAPKNFVKVGSATDMAKKSKADIKNDKKQVKLIKQEIKEKLKKTDDRSGLGTLLLVIIAIIIPPVAVLLTDGLKGPFWLDILLTLLFYLPGLIYALFRIFSR
jgi:uncharacterized membrane protein YqaE (UPF0057 family)